MMAREKRNEREAHDALSKTAKYRLLDVLKGEIQRERRRADPIGPIEHDRRVMKPTERKP